MKVLLTKALQPADRDYLGRRLDADVELVSPASFDEAGIVAALEAMTPGGADVLLGGLVTEPVLAAAAAAGARLLQVPWTGVDTVDLAAVERHGLTLANSHSNATVVAEHALALLLALAKKVPYHDRELRAGRWNRVSPEGNAVSPFSSSLVGAAVTLVGFGGIGTAMARLLAGFDCRLTVVTRSGAPDAEADARLGVVRRLPTARLREGLNGADAVLLAVPLTDDTRALVDAAAFEAMGPGVLFVNVSRGTAVDEAALFEALSERRIAGAAIDTWYRYPSRDEPDVAPSARFDFGSLDNLVLSPHRAGYVAGGFPHLDDAAENLNRVARGEAPRHVVSRDRGY